MSSLASLPGISIEIGNAPLATPELVALQEIRVDQRLSLPTQCELVFV